MSIGSIGSRSALSAQSLVDMRRQLDELQRQLGTGKKADSYAGMGLTRGLGVGLRSQLSSIAGFNDVISNVNVRLNIGQSVLTRIGAITGTVKADTFQTIVGGSERAASAQAAANAGLSEIFSLLNTQVGDRYIFSGRAADQPSVESYDRIMDGDGARAGFRQVAAERKQADLGASGLGRLVLSAPTATSVQVGEDAAGSPFGFKLSGVNATLSNATLTGPAGAPPAVSVDFTGQPAAGETIQLRLNMPDGTSATVTLTATASSPAGTNEFSIGASPADTAANLQSALTTSIGTAARTSLTAASAMAAADNFFNGTPQRVAGPPFDSATALVAGTSSDTMSWYLGEDGSDPARSTSVARVDSTINVSYGMRASEEGIRWVVQTMAAVAVTTLPPGDPDTAAAAVALHQRAGANLDTPPGVQTVADISSELASAQSTMKAATDRHRQTGSALSGMLQEIEGVSTEEVAAQILAMQVRLQASMQTTAMLYQLNLANYI